MGKFIIHSAGPGGGVIDLYVSTKRTVQELSPFQLQCRSRMSVAQVYDEGIKVLAIIHACCEN